MARSHRWIYAGAWTALIVIYTAAFVANGVAIDLGLRNALAAFVPGAGLGLILLRLPAMLAHRRHVAAAHVGCFVGFLVANALGWIGLVVLDGLVFEGTVDVHLDLPAVTRNVLNGVLIYATLVGVAYAWHNAEALREQAERAARAEALRARAALEAMRAQLNPHFILNTFHALLGLVRRDPALAEAALEQLGDLLRYSLRIQRDGIDEVPLRDECTFVDSYLALERLRLGDRLAVSVEVPPAALDCLVPTFAVQTLVENAVRHAIAPRAAGGSVAIRVDHAGGRLRVAVTDAGVGQVVNGHDNGARIGLRLLEERVAALYGTAATLAIRAVDGGTCAALELPAHTGAEDA